MVQRKGPEIGSPEKAEPTKGPPRYACRQQLQQQKKNYTSWDQDMRNKLSDLKRMLKKQRSIRRIAEMDDLEVHFGQKLQQEQQPEKSKELPPKPLKPMAETTPPNYMKPTSSSGARSERSRLRGIAHPVPSTDRSNCSGSKHGPNSGTSRPPSPACSGQKSGKLPTWRSGSREVRRSLLFPGVSASKATCSSTLKDSRFPRELELSPGSTEADGTSTMKVCPFTYCSLNGHWHLPLPPLRSFISARRRLLKTQKSVRLKRLSSCRRRCSRRSDEKQQQQQQQFGAEDESHHTDDDFFIEIYADSYRDSAESAVYPSNPEEEEEYKEEEGDGNLAACAANNDEDDMNSEIFSELFPSSHQDSAESVIFLSDYEDGNEEEDGGGAGNVAASDCDMDSETFSELLLGCGEGMGCNYGPDQVDVLSVKEVEVVAAFLDYIDGDSFSSSGGCEGWDCDGYLEINSSDIGEQLSDTDAYEALLEAIDLSWAEEMTECTGDEASTEGRNRCLSCEDDVIPMSDGIDFDLENICSELEVEFLRDLYNSGFSEQNSETFATESSYKNQQTESDGWNSGDGDDDVEEILFGLGLLCPAEVSTRKAITEDSPSFEEGTGGDGLGKSFSFEEIEFFEQFIAEANREPVVDVASGEGFNSSEAELNSEAGLKHEECRPAASQETLQQEAAEDSAGTTEEGSEAAGDESSSEALVSNLDPIGNNKDRSSSKEDTGTGSGKLKLKLNTARKSGEDDEEFLKPFNPRSPNFLSVEPDPEAEKVDLRHQEMEERRNSEEWMIDHALQEIVTKLAPARKKKVALIVEAIESVVPVPMEPSPVKRSGDIGFLHDKSVQACS